MIRIAIVDDHAIVRAGLRQFFADHVDFVVAAEAANGREALDILRQGEVDVMLLDISMPSQASMAESMSLSVKTSAPIARA
jgi:YesN/AraC family two-component response regulator